MSDNVRPSVSVCCITYNHEEYIRDTIEGFLIQKTSFPIEIIIHDDCSTDKTAQIVKEYACRYPEKLKTIFQKTNQYSLGKKIFPIVFSAARGDYIAICEGDDYWTDPDKLARQVEFLENNPDYIMVTENSIDDNLKNNTKKLFSQLPERDIDIFELLGDRSFTTASVLFRNLGGKIIPPGQISGDLILWCHLSKLGKIKYLENISSVYRRHHQGVTGGDLVQWSKKMVDWNSALMKNHPEISKEIFVEKNLKQFKYPVGNHINNNSYYKALLAIDELVDYTGEPSLYRNSLYEFFEELVNNKVISIDCRVGKLLISPLRYIYRKLRI